ncbi:MAG TPA: hypothetical protein VG944_07360 [Fimbriimonas sp.]|nr:hypothetical protein [Fimbriimonas sp.]
MRVVLLLGLAAVLVGCGASAQTSASDEKLLHDRLSHPPNARNRGAARMRRGRRIPPEAGGQAPATTGTTQ